ncbi:MAG: helix-turn-helix domain-containing protein [bacterium]|nr:helix-turn-helix domain-containing protein [bacterium]
MGKDKKITKTGNIEAGRQVKSEASVEFGKRLKEARKQLHISQKDFAARLEIAGSYLSEVEAGKTRPGFEFFYKVSKLFRINTDYLLHGQGPVFWEEESLPYRDVDFGSLNREIQNLIWYMEHSPIVQFAMLEHFSRYLYQYAEVIEKEVEKNREKKKPIPPL